LSKRTPDPPNRKQPFHPADYESRLKKLQGREWSIWGTSLTIVLCLTAGLASLSFAAAVQDKNVRESVAGLTILVVLFGCYSTYEKVLINRLRLEMTQNHTNSALWRDIALIDPLTGLFNRRYAEQRLKEEISRSRRKGYPLTLVMFDLNNFKSINDQFGHAAGDTVLKAFAECLGKIVRETDVAARLGGDEFVMLLTECDAVRARAIVDRLKPDDVDLSGRAVPIRFAVGWKQYELGEQARDMMKHADEALYQDKQRHKSAARTQSERSGRPLFAAGTDDRQ
jgi:diguanylate cyclase (GGDEF)-like protein